MRYHKISFKVFGLLLLNAIIVSAYAASNRLESTALESLSDNATQVVLQFAQPVEQPHVFITKHPPRVVMDFKGVDNGLKDKVKQINQGPLKSITAVEANGRTRVIVSLTNNVPYKTLRDKNKLFLTLTGNAPAKNLRSQGTNNAIQVATARSVPLLGHINNIDFNANKSAEGKIIVDVSDPSVSVDLQQHGNELVANFLHTSVPANLQRSLDVSDYGTPVQSINAKNKGKYAELKIKSTGPYEHYAYQVDKQFVIEVHPKKASAKAKLSRRTAFKGKPISLNFQDIKVRAVLQILSDFTGTNIVVSDTVTGNITLRLQQVPWDQALDIILRTRGLDKRQTGNVMLVAPSKEIAAREKEELENQKQVDELIPTHAELIQINYARASDIADLLKDESNSLLSSRGNVSVDERTNTLWIQDTKGKLHEIRNLITKLDIPVKQVLIEARIVKIDKNFERNLGIRFGITHPRHVSGTFNGANQLANNTPAAQVDPITDRLNLNLPAQAIGSTQATSVGLALVKLGSDVLLDLELSALESEGHSKTIASPHLMTANQQAAVIESGEEIPYEQSTSSGATAVAFKKAVLSLQVTPHITPDHKIILSLQVNQDTKGEQITENGPPAINTNEIQTQVLVDNGQTVVLGGIYTQNKSSTITRVPFLGKLPLLGVLFRNKTETNDRSELLIFVTPRIVEQGYAR